MEILRYFEPVTKLKKNIPIRHVDLYTKSCYLIDHKCTLAAISFFFLVFFVLSLCSISPIYFAINFHIIFVSK